jgi:hypothetical protein
MTDFLDTVRPVEPTPSTEPVPLQQPVEPSVRDLLAELAHLEDVVRASGSSVDDPDVLEALAREQAIVEELRQRNP